MVASFTPRAAVIVPIVASHRSGSGMRTTRRRPMVPVRPSVVFWTSVLSRRRSTVMTRRRRVIARWRRRRRVARPGRGRRRSGVSVMALIPAALYEINRDTACTVFSTVTSPVASMIIGNCQVNRSTGQSRADRNYGVRIPQGRRHALNRQHAVVTGCSYSYVDIDMHPGVRRQGNTNREE